MSVPIPTNSFLRPAREMRPLLFKWLVALLVPLLIFTFLWQGDSVINNVLLGFLQPRIAPSSDPSKLIQVAIFMAFFYLTVLALAGYLVAADSGSRKAYAVWIDSLLFAVAPILLIDL